MIDEQKLTPPEEETGSENAPEVGEEESHTDLPGDKLDEEKGSEGEEGSGEEGIEEDEEE